MNYLQEATELTPQQLNKISKSNRHIRFKNGSSLIFHSLESETAGRGLNVNIFDE